MQNLNLSHDIFQGKSVAVVGNSRMIMTREDGGLIDSCDVVVRFNRQFPVRPECQGARTDICSLSRNMIRGRRFSKPDSCPDVKFYRCDISLEFTQYVQAEMGLPSRKLPSSGARMLHYLLEAGALHTYVFGFDGLRTADWNSPKKRHHRAHSRSAEVANLAYFASLPDFTVQTYG